MERVRYSDAWAPPSPKGPSEGPSKGPSEGPSEGPSKGRGEGEISELQSRLAEVFGELDVARKLNEAMDELTLELDEDYKEYDAERKRLMEKLADAEASLLENKRQVQIGEESVAKLKREIADVEKEAELIGVKEGVIELLERRRDRSDRREDLSGFVKPTLISDQLAEFLDKPKGSLIARTEVTREINAYIRANKLQDPENGRKINPDAKLTKLLALTATDELTFFNIQKFMSQHFLKA